MPETGLLTEYGAADLLNISSEAVRRMARDGRLPVVILPGEILRFRVADLHDWIVTHRRPSVEPLTTR